MHPHNPKQSTGDGKKRSSAGKMNASKPENVSSRLTKEWGKRPKNGSRAPDSSRKLSSGTLQSPVDSSDRVDDDEGFDIVSNCQAHMKGILSFPFCYRSIGGTPIGDGPVAWAVITVGMEGAMWVLRHMIEFFTRRRVMLVFLVIAGIFGYFNFVEEISSLRDSFVVADADRPGVLFMRSHTIRRKHPVMIIPGFISTALEVWQDVIECNASQPISSMFRQRMLGPSMLFLLATDPACYMKLFSLDKHTGFDPPGVKIRPDMGFGSADFFMPGYWVWAKIFVNLADIGYDPQSMGIFSYDWRLSPQGMHQRDGYYYYLRNYLLYLYHKNNERVVIISHSYGSVVVTDFLRWADKHEPGWTNKHVANWINIGGTLMGVTKTVSALLSGDAKDTLTLPGPARKILDAYLLRNLRIEMFRTWSCQAAMLPRGCDGVSPHILRFRNGTRLSMKDVVQLLVGRLKESGHFAVQRQLQGVLDRFGSYPALPKAPNMTVLCLYGVGVQTEVGYVLGDDGMVDDTYNEDDRIINGVINGDGDGTVTLMSMGYICRAKNGWRQDVGRVITREHNHSLGPSMNLRGGPLSGGHVDILGNRELVWTILKVVSGNAEEGELSDRIFSDIDKRIEESGDCLSMRKEGINER